MGVIVRKSRLKPVQWTDHKRKVKKYYEFSQILWVGAEVIHPVIRRPVTWI